MAPMTQTYSVAEAARLLGVSDESLYRLLRKGEAVAGVRAIKLGRSYRLPKRPLDAAVAGEPEQVAS